MSDPVPFTIRCIEWNIFRTTIGSQFFRDVDGRFKRQYVEDDVTIEWCFEHIAGEWTWAIPNGSCHQSIYIKEKTDAMLFKLTWPHHCTKLTFSKTG